VTFIQDSYKLHYRTQYGLVNKSHNLLNLLGMYTYVYIREEIRTLIYLVRGIVDKSQNLFNLSSTP
jgi:hypothetical protein